MHQRKAAVGRPARDDRGGRRPSGRPAARGPRRRGVRRDRWAGRRPGRGPRAAPGTPRSRAPMPGRASSAAACSGRPSASCSPWSRTARATATTLRPRARGIGSSTRSTAASAVGGREAVGQPQPCQPRRHRISLGRNDSAGHGSRAGQRDLLADDGAQQGLDVVDAARGAEAGASGDERASKGSAASPRSAAARSPSRSSRCASRASAVGRSAGSVSASSAVEPPVDRGQPHDARTTGQPQHPRVRPRRPRTPGRARRAARGTRAAGARRTAGGQARSRRPVGTTRATGRGSTDGRPHHDGRAAPRAGTSAAANHRGQAGVGAAQRVAVGARSRRSSAGRSRCRAGRWPAVEATHWPSLCWCMPPGRLKSMHATYWYAGHGVVERLGLAGPPLRRRRAAWTGRGCRSWGLAGHRPSSSWASGRRRGCRCPGSRRSRSLVDPIDAGRCLVVALDPLAAVDQARSGRCWRWTAPCTWCQMPVGVLLPGLDRAVDGGPRRRHDGDTWVEEPSAGRSIGSGVRSPQRRTGPAPHRGQGWRRRPAADPPAAGGRQTGRRPRPGERAG